MHEEVFFGAEVAEAVNDEYAVGTQSGLYALEAFGGHKVGWRRVAKKGVQEDGVVLSACGAEEVSSVVNVEVDLRGVKTEEVSRNVGDARIDFHDIYSDAFGGELSRDDADAKPDDKSGV